jgi:hypothetical protein
MGTRATSASSTGSSSDAHRGSATADVVALVPWSLVPGQARVRPRYPQLGLSKKNVMPLALALRCATS